MGEPCKIVHFFNMALKHMNHCRMVNLTILPDEPVSCHPVDIRHKNLTRNVFRHRASVNIHVHVASNCGQIALK